MQIERRLIDLGKELDDATVFLTDAEHDYMKAKAAYEVASAKWRMTIRAKALEKGVKITVAEVDDESLLRCQDELTVHYTTEATVKAARANLNRIRTQIDIGRSLGTSVRASLEAL
jgi:hypothetical protein